MKRLAKLLRDSAHKVWEWVKTHVPMPVVSVATGTISYGLLSWLAGPIPALLVLLVISAHEFGHYFAGKFYGADTWWPIYVPLGIGILGLTRVWNLDARHVGKVALAGPASGLVMAVILILVFAFGGYTGLYLMAWLLLGYEVLSFLLGKDLKTYRRYAKEAKI